MKLYSYQQKHKEALLNILSRSQAAADLSDTGTGKTFVACSIAKELGLPTLVICPKVVIPQWDRCLEGFEVSLASAINLESLKSPNFVKEEHVIKKVLVKGKIRYVSLLPKNTLIIFDEAHKVGGRKTINSFVLSAFIEAGHKLLFLSATLAVSPLRLNEVGRALGLYRDSSDHWSWLFSHGVKKAYFGGLEWHDPNGKYMGLIHKDLFPDRASRMSIKDIEEFPDNYFYTTPIKVMEHSTDEVNGLWKEFIEHREKPIKSQGYMETLRHLEALRVEIYLDMILGLLDEGKSVVVFLSCRSPLAELARLLDDKGITYCSIYGGQKESDRQKNIEDFQGNNTHVMLCMIQAGGVGLNLHDLHGRPRHSILSPTYDAVQLKQALGRIHRIGSKSKATQCLPYIAGTVEEDIVNSLAMKVRNINILNEGEDKKLCKS